MSKKISPQQGKTKERLDTMPEPLRAIQCYKDRNYAGLRSANKMGIVFPTESVRYNVEIGSASYEGLG